MLSTVWFVVVVWPASRRLFAFFVCPSANPMVTMQRDFRRRFDIAPCSTTQPKMWERTYAMSSLNVGMTAYVTGPQRLWHFFCGVRETRSFPFSNNNSGGNAKRNNSGVGGIRLRYWGGQGGHIEHVCTGTIKFDIWYNNFETWRAAFYLFARRENIPRRNRVFLFETPRVLTICLH